MAPGCKAVYALSKGEPNNTTLPAHLLDDLRHRGPLMGCPRVPIRADGSGKARLVLRRARVRVRQVSSEILARLFVLLLRDNDVGSVEVLALMRFETRGGFEELFGGLTRTDAFAGPGSL
jgi:hypothetical protein